MKTENNEFPETLTQAVHYFANDERAFEFVKMMKFPDGVVRCPKCEADNVGFIATRKVWKCRECKKQFSVKVGTIFEDSPLGLDKWLPAFWMIVNAKNGISSCELARAIGVTQKSAWHMLHRIRLAVQDDSVEKMSGHVEADETFIGGKARLMNNKAKRKRGKVGTGPVAMAAVQGLLERGKKGKPSRVKLMHVETRKKAEIQQNVRDYVLEGSEVHTDALKSYEGLNEYVHNVVDHAECYVKGHVHTNGMENFWSLLKRAIKGTYVSVEPFHLFRYLDEQAFRFNLRKEDDQSRFLIGMRGIVGKLLRYKKLIGNAPSDGLPTFA
jgi:transposase-like protein